MLSDVEVRTYELGEAADAEEAFAAGPEVVSVESVMEAATGEMESE